MDEAPKKAVPALLESWGYHYEWRGGEWKLHDSAWNVVTEEAAFACAKAYQRQADENWQRIYARYRETHPQRETPQVLEGNSEWKR